MAITRAAKEEQVAALKDILAQSQLTVLAAYTQMSVPQAQELRSSTKSQNGGFRVVKNAMLKRAVAETFEECDISHLEGPIAIAYSNDDAVMPAKTVMDFAKEHEVLEPLMAIDESGNLYEAEDVKRLASLPSREELTGQLVGTIAAPLRGFVTVLEGNMRGLVTVLDGIANK